MADHLENLGEIFPNISRLTLETLINDNYEATIEELIELCLNDVEDHHVDGGAAAGAFVDGGAADVPIVKKNFELDYEMVTWLTIAKEGQNTVIQGQKMRLKTLISYRFPKILKGDIDNVLKVYKTITTAYLHLAENQYHISKTHARLPEEWLTLEEMIEITECEAREARKLWKGPNTIEKGRDYMPLIRNIRQISQEDYADYMSGRKELIKQAFVAEHRVRNQQNRLVIPKNDLIPRMEDLLGNIRGVRERQAEIMDEIRRQRVEIMGEAARRVQIVEFPQFIPELIPVPKHKVAEFICSFCIENVSILDKITCQGSEKHQFCKSCIQKTFEAMAYGNTKIIDGCFEPNCTGNFNEEDLDFISGKTMGRLRFRKLENGDLKTKVVYHCSFCPYIGITTTEESEFQCLSPECARKICKKCKSEFHPGDTCEEKMKKSKKRMDTAEKATENLTQVCPKCDKRCLREEGCAKMKCNCGFDFCWYCLQDLKIDGYNHYCNCEGGRYGGSRRLENENCKTCGKCILFATNLETDIRLADYRARNE